MFDASFMKDQEAALNFAQASVGKVTAAAKAIIARYYGQAPTRSYFVGCSTGGREGMIASQRYPAEFDGIVAGAPAMRTGRSNLGLAWANHVFAQISPKGENGKPDPTKAFSPSDQKLVTDAIVAACDAKDGLKDGMIFNTRQCSFDPAALACSGAKTDACLSPSRRARSPRPSPARGTRAALSPIRPSRGTAASRRRALRSPASSPPARAARSIRNVYETIDVDAIEDRMNADGMDRLQATANWTNLNSFFGHGGKILFYHGVSDPWFSALDTIDYYERMAKSSGGMDQVRANSSRAYLVPGMGHCQTGRDARALRPAAGRRRLGRARQGAGFGRRQGSGIPRPQPAALRLAAIRGLQGPGQSGGCRQLRMP